ncbi:hypothetical protein HJG60_017061 [Phyllostomus discolor]|uniref:Uncharacterized protein n=1 Tax=Phyllostomus discolor TaxID=89673 RepID=A0A834BLD6_9CHIR|nr:hypothetical protein HJG60_017061 [Phyllostomus discolor]
MWPWSVGLELRVTDSPGHGSLPRASSEPPCQGNLACASQRRKLKMEGFPGNLLRSHSW